MEALVNVDSSLICARIIQVFVGAFFYIFVIAKAVGSENKPNGLKEECRILFLTAGEFLGNILILVILSPGRGLLFFLLFMALFLDLAIGMFSYMLID